MMAKKSKKAPVGVDASYEEKWALLNRNMRWEVADLLREHNLPTVNTGAELPVITEHSFYVRYGKRTIDIVISSLALLITSPLNLVVAVMTMLTLGMPILFKQQRLGRNGELFTLVKFRNMRNVFDENGHPLPGHMRVTRLGKFMRRTSLDELLNFWSILKGDMSLIGPRPLVPEYGPRYSDRHRLRMAVKPGLECPARDAQHPVTNYQEQFENDVWYVEHVSLKTDLMLIRSLIGAVMDRRGSKIRAASVKGAFLGYDNQSAISSRNAPVWAIDMVLRDHGLLMETAPADLES